MHNFLSLALYLPSKRVFFRLRMSQNRRRLGLRSRPPDEAYSAPQTPHLDSGKGPGKVVGRKLTGQERQEGGRKRGGKGKEKGRGRE